MADQSSCMTVGEGDIYTTFQADCMNIINQALLDPTSDISVMITDWCGMEIPEIQQALSNLVYCEEYGLYIDPIPNSDRFTLSGEYSDLSEAILVAGEELVGLDCASASGPLIGPGAHTVINSHQGVGGL